jgi:hypothetical protein
MGEDFSDVNVVFSANDGGKSFTAEVTTGPYDPGNLVEIDRAIRHMPAVVKYITKKAEECRASIEKSDDFHVIVSTGGEGRARAYVAPANDGGVHLELGDSVLLKAALSMEGK